MMNLIAKQREKQHKVMESEDNFKCGFLGENIMSFFNKKSKNIADYNKFFINPKNYVWDKKERGETFKVKFFQYFDA